MGWQKEPLEGTITYEIALPQWQAWLPCIKKTAMEEEDVLSFWKNQVLRKLPLLFNLTSCDFPKPATCLLKKENPKEGISTESPQQFSIFLCLPMDTQLRWVFQDKGSLREEKLFRLQLQSQPQGQVLEICIQRRILGPLFPSVCTLMILSWTIDKSYSCWFTMATMEKTSPTTQMILVHTLVFISDLEKKPTLSLNPVCPQQHQYHWELMAMHIASPSQELPNQNL